MLAGGAHSSLSFTFSDFKSISSKEEAAQRQKNRVFVSWKLFSFFSDNLNIYLNNFHIPFRPLFSLLSAAVSCFSWKFITWIVCVPWRGFVGGAAKKLDWFSRVSFHYEWSSATAREENRRKIIELEWVAFSSHPEQRGDGGSEGIITATTRWLPPLPVTMHARYVVFFKRL